jgi:hypothetical protein
MDGRIAQVVEQLTLNQRVVGSSPTAPTKDFKELDQYSIAQNQTEMVRGNAWGNKKTSRF